MLKAWSNISVIRTAVRKRGTNQCEVNTLAGLLSLCGVHIFCNTGQILIANYMRQVILYLCFYGSMINVPRASTIRVN